MTTYALRHNMVFNLVTEMANWQGRQRNPE